MKTRKDILLGKLFYAIQTNRGVKEAIDTIKNEKNKLKELEKETSYRLSISLNDIPVGRHVVKPKGGLLDTSSLTRGTLLRLWASYSCRCNVRQH